MLTASNAINSVYVIIPGLMIVMFVWVFDFYNIQRFNAKKEAAQTASLK